MEISHFKCYMCCSERNTFLSCAFFFWLPLFASTCVQRCRWKTLFFCPLEFTTKHRAAFCLAITHPHTHTQACTQSLVTERVKWLRRAPIDTAELSCPSFCSPCSRSCCALVCLMSLTLSLPLAIYCAALSASKGNT